MMTPQPPEGERESARLDVLMAVKMLEKSLAAFGSTTDDGKAVLKAIKGLSQAFGQQEGKTEELMPAEIKQLLAGLAGPGTPPGAPPGAPPGGPPGGGAAPPGMPPG